MALNPRRLVRPLLRLLVLGVAGYYAIWGGEYTAFDLLRLDEQQQAERMRLEQLHAEVDSLRLLAGQLESDPAMLERVARERFGMIRPGETLYRFVEVDPPAEPAADEPGTP